MTGVVAVYGEGFFHVAWGLIYYTIVFDYYDRTGEYYEYMGDPRIVRREEEYARRKMQSLMDEERILVNGVETRALVDTARIFFRGDRRRHSLVFHVRIPYDPLEGLNLYENYYEPVIAEYPYIVYWIAQPGGRIRLVETPGKVTRLAGDRIVEIRIRRGTRLEGYEAVEFEAHQQVREDLQPPPQD